MVSKWGSTMAFVRTAVKVCVVVAGTFVAAPQAFGAGTLYNMNYFLQEAHPFANTRNTVAPAAAQPISKPRKPLGRASKPAFNTPAAMQPEVADNTTSDGWLSEIRGGVLKHSIASVIGKNNKETGIDANMEVLFNSPDWLGFLWSPRPHLGGSFNTSSTNTDLAYAGLTWEWQFWRSMFFNFSFGGAIHNGELEYDAGVPFPADAGRHREFGCRVLFRESFELGWIFAKRHGVSAMWSHYSHGGICGGQNEGLDNAGIRYGYRF